MLSTIHFATVVLPTVRISCFIFCIISRKPLPQICFFSFFGPTVSYWWIFIELLKGKEVRHQLMIIIVSFSLRTSNWLEFIKRLLLFHSNFLSYHYWSLVLPPDATKKNKRKYYRFLAMMRLNWMFQKQIQKTPLFAICNFHRRIDPIVL